MRINKIRHLIILACLLTALHGLFWFLYAEVLSAGSLQRRKASLFQTERNKSASIWILGDSHPMMALNPACIPGSFNFACTSEYYFLNLQKLRSLLKDSQRPELIVLPLDLHSFSSQGNALLLQHELDDVYWSQLLDGKEIRSWNLPSEWMRWFISARYFPYAGQYYRFISWFKEDPYQVEANGFVPASEAISDQNQSERDEAAQARYQAHVQKFPARDFLQIKALQEIKITCRKEGIKLVLVSFPLSDDYLKMADGDSGLNPIRALQDSMKANDHYLNFSRVFSGLPEYFSDPDHLNSKGAEQLSKILKPKLDSIRKRPF
jgi:hypothetical protein